MELPTHKSNMHPIDCAFHLIVYFHPNQAHPICALPHPSTIISIKIGVQSHRGHILSQWDKETPNTEDMKFDEFKHKSPHFLDSSNPHETALFRVPQIPIQLEI
jgi:hypothetical protein